MTAPRRLLALLAAASSLPGWAGAPADDWASPDGGFRRPGPELSAEDREVVENLDLLESLDEAGDLDLLLDLAEEE